ncbi:YIP1 family protein [Aliiroseovarius sp. S1339]|uniref:YIP1 family protein n=1 Tax=Aliiroseovarius sp. S1339 TaxID=2936990 RepID=UPI0020BF8EFE|nr:YIP1 family protein [Aliiroseovarius sp. S1339]MCK8462277.1 YIP1 family protein [Aliiroseovarius sp. S1339]
MSVIDDVIRSYRAPRAVFQRRLSMGTREDKALAVLMGGCLLVFAAQLPRLARVAHETGEDLNMLMGATMLAWIFIMPLAFYLIGTLSHFVMRLVGGRGTAFRARFALFWALLCATPLWLLWGMVAGFIGEGVQMTVTGALALLAFLLFWSINLREAERQVEG